MKHSNIFRNLDQAVILIAKLLMRSEIGNWPSNRLIVSSSTWFRAGRLPLKP